MNRYQREVVAIDRRHRVVVRLVSFVGAACLAVAALWSAGLPPTQWLDALHRWSTSSPALPSASEQSTATLPLPVATNAPLGQVSNSPLPSASTPLTLYLVSTAPGRSANEGTARIGTSVENPQTYASGALLANGAQLSEIHADHVVLMRGTETALLYLHRDERNARNPQAAGALLSVGVVAAAPTPPQVVGEGLTDYLRPSPIYDGEIMLGVQVYPGVRAGVFAKLGLQPGDVVTSINDAPLNEPAQALELLAQLVRGAAVVASVERKGVPERITLDGALISADQQRSREAAVAAGT